MAVRRISNRNPLMDLTNIQANTTKDVAKSSQRFLEVVADRGVREMYPIELIDSILNSDNGTENSEPTTSASICQKDIQLASGSNLSDQRQKHVHFK